MAVTQKVTLYNNKFTVPPVINAVQNDTDRQVEAYFGDFTLQVGMIGKLSFIRSDGTHYEVSATLSTANNTATAELDQALTQAGVTQAQLKITDSGNVGSTFTFMIKVQPDVAGISQQQDGYSAEELAQGIADNASAIENIENVELLKKADQDGYYEDLTSGTSLAVLGTPTTESVPYLFRRSASVGVRESDKIIGGTVAWNQHIKDGNFASGSEWASANASSISVSGNVLTATASGSSLQVFQRDSNAISAGHKIYMAVSVKASVADTVRMRYGQDNPLGSTQYKEVTLTANTKTRIEHVFNSYEILNQRYGFFCPSSSNNNVYELSNFICVDLTQALGSAIADYIYGLETATAGAGISKLKEWGFFTKDYYDYDSGSLQSVKTSAHKTVGKNVCKQGSSGNIYNGGNLIPVKSGDTVYVYGEWTYTENAYMWGGIWASATETNKNNRLLMLGNMVSGSTATYNITQDCYFGVAFSAGVANYTVSKMMISFAPISGASDYEPYWQKSYPLSDIDLRGIPKLDANNKLYYDGDEYKSDGAVVRKYGSIDLGSLSWTFEAASAYTYGRIYTTGLASLIKKQDGNMNLVCTKYNAKETAAEMYNSTDGMWESNAGNLSFTNAGYNDSASFKTAMNGVYLYFELATPTTENADPFHDPQICSPYGTEEYIDTRDVPVPVGHETEYYADPVAEIERVAVQVPVPPSANGTYRLTCVVSGGVPTYSWTS